MTPFQAKSKLGQKYDVPCGKCPNCLKRRVSGWSFRLMQHEKISHAAFFVTLTYNTDHVPITKNGFMSLEKTDLQKYFKRLRKLHPKGSIPLKYYACGEYGSKRFRPHYHFIIFNADRDLIERAWRAPKDMGDIFIGDVSEASVGYVLKYMCKPKLIPMHKNDDRQKEWSLMSKGLGANYLSDKIIKFHASDLENRMYCPLPDGKKIALPRYYAQKIYNDSQREIQMLLAENASIQSDRDSYEKFRALKYDATYPEYKDSQRLGRYNQFYSQQKKRNL